MKQDNSNNINEWIKMYNDGYSFRKIAEEYGVAMTTVKRRISPYVEIKPRNKYGKYADEWLNLFNSGVKKCEIARMYQVSPSTVGSVLSKVGVKRYGNKKFLHLVDDMKKLYISGLSLKEISDKLNISTQAIADYLEFDGVSRRPYTEACRNYDINENMFESVETCEKAFLLGVIWVIGNVVYDGQKPRNIRFVTTKENLISLAINNIYCNDGDYTLREVDATYRKDVQCIKLTNDLIKLGFSNKGNKQVPKFKNVDLTNSFIEGLLYSRLVFSTDKAYTKYLDEPLIDLVANYFVETLNIKADCIKGFCKNENSVESNSLTIFKKSEIKKLQKLYTEITEKYSKTLGIEIVTF